MSKQHAIIPHWFTESQAANPAILRKAYYVKKDELRKLISQGMIRQFGASGKLWQWAEHGITHDSRRVQSGRLAFPQDSRLRISQRLADLMASEMALRPSWSMSET